MSKPVSKSNLAKKGHLHRLQPPKDLEVQESLITLDEILQELPKLPQKPPRKPAQLTKGMSRSLSREFESKKFEGRVTDFHTRRLDFETYALEHSRSQTHHIVETSRIYSKEEQKKTIQSPTGDPVVSQGKVNQYHLFDSLGCGSFGRVVLALDDITQELYACKIISKSRIIKQLRFSPGGANAGLELVRREIAILKKVSNHPKIIKLYEVLDDKNEDNLYLFFELCEKGPVMQLVVGSIVPSFSEDLARQYFRDIVLGLEFLHFKRIAHCDIKPENLLLNAAGVVQIGDFGISRVLEGHGLDMIPAFNTSPLFTPPCSLEG
ncbi:kinase-like domain-containing protein [Globomyces pollinis-pini]|nr:kinase-like domain-containing protein [Globomyces pollinis-pini]